jgi:cytochrome c
MVRSSFQDRRMASLEGNKAFAAILVAGMAFMVAGFVADVLVHPEELEKTAIAIQGAAETVSGPARVVIPSILPLLAGAKAADGQILAAQSCGTCHSFDAGGAAMVGPDLYGVVGAKVASSGSYPYSAALKKIGGTWTYETLNHWLLDPQAFAPGTLMSYAGMRSIQSRADVIAYLRTLAAAPVPLPTAAEIATAVAAQKQAETAAAAPSSGGGGGSTAPVGPTLDQLLASGNADAGASFAQTACGACHSFDKGGATQVGPNLYGIVDSRIAGTPGYAFSDALKKIGGAWDFARLDAWLTNPQSFAPGTTMSYAGIAQPKMRANVVDYLRTLADQPVPLPAATAAPAKGPTPDAKSGAPGTAGSTANP